MDFGPASVEGWLAELGARQRLAGDESGIATVRGVGYRYPR